MKANYLSIYFVVKCGCFTACSEAGAQAVEEEGCGRVRTTGQACPLRVTGRWVTKFPWEGKCWPPSAGQPLGSGKMRSSHVLERILINQS